MSDKKSPTSKWIVAVVLLICIVLFFYYDLGRFFTLEYLHDSQARFNDYYTNNPTQTISIYMVIYILITALSLPGAAVMTLAGGSLFGLFSGTLIVSFASTIGATLAMIISRWLFRDYIQNKFQNHIKTINDGIEKDGAFYLFTLRLVPAVPFFVINAGMGLAKIRVWTFYWVSQVGMFLGTIVYVNAGSELAKIESLKDIVSPRLLIAFILLGIMPLILKKILSIIKKKKDL